MKEGKRGGIKEGINEGGGEREREKVAMSLRVQCQQVGNRLLCSLLETSDTLSA